MTVHDELDKSLRRLEATMKAANLWQMETPEPSAFDSQEPFCVDTMALPQWLRFVFIARLDALVERRAPLPARCDVAPALAAYFAQQGGRASDRLLLWQVVEEIDRLITEN
ncbi:YqcC family protein [Halomonas sp. KAO]|uniref:YqcC family protein n=1 Tax=unclassified Halomonas TaxID=2609666 RepID=UPI00189E70E5|nr:MULTISPECIES: YqcC family protein [unclassified Halomonas]MBF7052086.1 YqcC family protein [Halomonas sp. KAO]MDT0500330.1 YqcC family protein [Halomonas sp. PAR7]MDT0511173.1 YqcC family protein [Halomonas sp. LES1]MDT0590538.1 YqcC family protein [Halomonas sp. PAR8]